MVESDQSVFLKELDVSLSQGHLVIRLEFEKTDVADTNGLTPVSVKPDFGVSLDAEYFVDTQQNTRCGAGSSAIYSKHLSLVREDNCHSRSTR